jgi:hypothetical protein
MITILDVVRGKLIQINAAEPGYCCLPTGGAAMRTDNSGPTAGPRRWGRAQRRSITDPYKSVKKLHEPVACPQCGAVYRAGHWKWTERPAAAHEELCPACQRINDDFPAGQLALTGQFVTQHLDDILRIVRHQEGIEKAEHPLNRIMNIEDTMGAIVVTTTEIHLLRRIGEALKRAFDGELKSNYDEDGYFLRATWHRD